MIPVLFSFGPFHLYSYGLSIALGVLLAFFLMKRQAVRDGFPAPEIIYDSVFVILIWGFIGARLLFVLQHFSYYWAEPWKVLAVWEGGLIFYGGVIASVAGFWIMTRRKKLSFWRLLDFIIPYGVLTHAFGRLGCFLNGCCYGKICDLPWAVHFPQLEQAVHPTQLYEAFYNLVLFFFLRHQQKKVRFEGQISLLYFLLYATGRFFLEFLREPSWVGLGLTLNQWLSLGAIAAVLFFLKIRQKKSS